MRHEADYDDHPDRPPYRDAPPKRTYVVIDLGKRVEQLERRVTKLERKEAY